MTEYWTKNIYIFQIQQKTVQTLLKWLFWTSINLDIIKQNISLAEVFVILRQVKSFWLVNIDLFCVVLFGSPSGSRG